MRRHSAAPPGCFVAVVAVTALIGLGFLATLLATLQAGDRPEPGSGATTTTVPGRQGERVLASMRGAGDRVGEPFATGRDWTMRWSFDCSGAPGGSGSFRADPDGRGPAPAIGGSGPAGRGTAAYPTGRYA
ncbi:MAG TPA: hypothetical protein VFD04_12775, partial [Actinomycetes bacterium]|nr:hypothetical protein [Actinomycetes bacterium]